MWFEQYKVLASRDGHGSEPEFHFGIVFLVVLPLAAAIGAVAWLGWTWQALVVAAVVTLLIGGVSVRKWVENWQRDRSQIPEWRR